MSKILYVNGRKVETKWEKLKRKTSEKAKNAMRWINQNKEMIVVLAPVAASSAALLGKWVIKPIWKGTVVRTNLRRQEHIKTRFIYDPSLGAYYELSRKLSNQQKIELDQRRQAGERIGNILREMNVLK